MAAVTLAAIRGERALMVALDPGLAGGAQRGQRRVLGQQVTDAGLVQPVADRPFQRRGDAGQGVAQPVGQPGLVGGQVDVEAVEHPQLREQLVRAGVQPVDLLAPGAAGVGEHVGVAPVGLGLAGIQVGGAAHHQPRHIRHRHAAGGRPPPGRAGRSSRAGRSPGPASPCPAARSSSASRSAWSLATARANSRSPSSSRTSAKCSSLPTSSPTHTSTCVRCGHRCPFLACLPVTCAGRPSSGALAVIHLTNQRSSRMSPSEVHAPTVPVATPPRPSPAAGGNEPYRHRRTSQAQTVLARAQRRR